MELKENSLFDWQSLIAEQSKSGLSKAAFCRQKGVKPPHFYYYESMLKQRNKSLPSKIREEYPQPFLVPIEIKKAAENHKLPEAQVIRFLLKNGMECVLPNAMDIKRLKEIIEVLVTC
jgi:hypothetical protein